jgi:hypothetical protein
MKQKNGKESRGTAAKRFVLTVLGSLFVQCFCWALYDYLKLSVWLCGLSAVVTAVLYHFVQREEETGLSRGGVFYAAILTPFLLSAIVTVLVFINHPQMTNLSAAVDGVSQTTELISLYSARLLLNGAALLIFAGIHAVWTAAHPPKERETHDAEHA